MTIDTTDQQAVTVAQEDREAAALIFPTHAMTIMSGGWDETENVQVFARHRLASVSSASAEPFLSQLRRVNLERYEAWVEGADAGIMFDALELGGEVGELLNIVKKLEREERGWRGSRANSADFDDECADVLICLDKLARRRNVDLATATIAKFNATSVKVGLPHRLGQPATSQENARGDFGVGQDELVAGLKRALQHPAGDHDGWTDAGMEDAFFRWPVIVNALNEALAATPTPATLSKDLREEAIAAVLNAARFEGADSPADYGDAEQIVDAVLAALAS